MEMLVPAMNSRRRDPQILSSSTVPSAYLLAAFSAYLRIPRALAAPAASDPSSSLYSPPPTATDIVSPSPPVEFASSSTHLSTYGIVGIVISGSLFMTAVIGYGLRTWKRYKRSRLPPSAQYRESVRVAANEEAETAAAEGGPVSSGAETGEVGAGVGAQAAAAASRKSEAGTRKGESATAIASREHREKRASRSSSSRKPARGVESKGRRESNSRLVRWSDAAPSAGPGPSTQASQPQSDLSGIEEVPR
ncbi:hypothetical protein K466DRAFT_581336 [Polyporus arcularius HHB13444]|uniref:Uncharacterized protein n=1 Tax=Polyporus arcularius HHB13444 TaxID=1314778 RepID=A0A5C3PWB6_9APHY|nr:hypothetical protein K466DRAFT_581336 [Polyporus arcularius HHB13444]